MELSDQCVNLELAKQLKELGTKQSSLFYHLIGGIALRIEALPLMGENWYSAFTSSELGQLLPSVIHGESATESSYSLNIHKYNEYWHINYSSGHKTKIVYYAENLANCMAGILIILIQNGMIKND